MTGNKSYQPGGSYHGKPPSTRVFYRRAPDRLTEWPAFAGKDASRALAKSSTKAEDVSPEWKDLDAKEQSTLNDWVTFFSKRYNVVGKVEGAANTE